jgi:glycosyltransferase involved in cell wall biosynthesis
MKVSICITSYECKGVGHEFIKRNMTECLKQTYRPLEVVISDHSIDNEIKTVVESFSHPEIEIKYLRYEENRGSPCANWNNCVSNSTGEMIRILAMDDYLSYENAISDSMVWINANPQHKWFVSHRCDEKNNIRTKKEAIWNSNILMINSVSGPSCVMVPKDLYLKTKMDSQFLWLFDLDFYYMLYSISGKPGIIPFYTWVNSIHKNQLTHSVQHRNKLEIQLLQKKYGYILPLSP